MFLAEVDDDAGYPVIGHVIDEPEIISEKVKISLKDAEKVYDSRMAEIFPIITDEPEDLLNITPNFDKKISFCPAYPLNPLKAAKFLIPVFTGTNCEYETARAVEMAGGNAQIFVVRSLTPEMMRESAKYFADALRDSQALIIPGGFSNGDEPDASGKFIAIFLRSPEVKSAVENLIDEHGGLICGICNGFQALIKTGLLPHGKFVKPSELSATLTFNRIGRHQSRIIRSVVVSNNSPWMSLTHKGDVYSMPISHGEGRFLCDDGEFTRLMMNGQICAQYCDDEGKPSMLTQYNPSGSKYAVECIASPDGRIIGRMGHIERNGRNLYRNVPGNYDVRFFEAACKYFAKS